MDLTKEYPRSPNAMMAGIVSLPRVIDKTRASDEGTLGEYNVDCPHDKPVLNLLGIEFPAFDAKLRELHYDDAKIEAWARELLAKRSPESIEAFNRHRKAWGPDAKTQVHFDALRDEVAPGRTDLKTWFELLDVDEKRAV